MVLGRRDTDTAAELDELLTRLEGAIKQAQSVLDKVATATRR